MTKKQNPASALRNYKVLTDSHTHRGVLKKPGEMIDLREDQAKRLAEQGVVDINSSSEVKVDG